MKIRSLLLLCLTVLLSAFAGKAQFNLDCSCLSTQAVLTTNACRAVVPDLCQFTNCWSSSAGTPGGLTCSQSPPAGTPVTPGSHTIVLTISDPNGQQQSCALTFTVNPSSNTMVLICAPDKTVECGTTWNVDSPIAVTNVCCPMFGTPDGAIVFLSSLVTNGTCPEVVTAKWEAFDGCMYTATCVQKITVVDSTPPVLDCNCLTNPAVNPVPLVLTVTNCSDVIPDLCHAAFACATDNCGFSCTQNPPPFTPVGPGVYPITVTVFDCASNAASCTVSFTVVAPSTGCGTNSCITPPPGLVGWWPLDELCGAGVFADLSGSGNAAVVESGGPLCSAGSPFAVAGKVAGAAYFYGATVRGRAPNAPSLNFGAGDFSVDAWVNPVPVGPQNWQPIVDKISLPTPTTAFGYAVGITNSRVELRVGNGGALTRLQSVNTVNFNNTWNFVAVSVDRTAQTVTFHVNGVNETPQTLTASGNFNSTVDLFIGGPQDPIAPVGELALDEVEIFSRALTNSEMTDLWNADRFGKCKPTLPCTNSVVSIFCPPDQTATTCSNSANVSYPPATASTSCGTIVSIACAPASGSAFPLGTTPVTCTATDSQGNTASCTFNVIVTPDRMLPACPPTSLSVTGCPPLMPDFGTLVTDNCTPVGQINVTQNPLAGAVLPAGVTPATIIACDLMGNCSTCLVSITAVYAGAAPTITCPNGVTVTGYRDCDNYATAAHFPPPVVSNGTLVGCSHSSGAVFPLGVTTVTCTATNACGTNTCSFTVFVQSGGIHPPCTPPPANMVMWLKFDETSGNTAFNSSSGNNGVLVNGPTRVLGQYVVNSLAFDGVNDYVQVQPYPAMQFGTGDFSVDAWVKTTSFNNTVRVIVDHREENGPTVRGYSLFLGANNLLAFQIADGPSFINYPSTLAVPPDGRWHMVAVTVKRNDPQGIKFYVDGVQQALGRDPTGHTGSVTAGPCYPFRVGSRSSTVSGLFPGSIDEVELFRRALTPAEIKAIYDARCRGKCPLPCQAGTGIALACWLPQNGGNGTPISTVIFNPLAVPMNYTYTYVPVTGPGCATPPTFTPASGTVLVPANSYYFPLPQSQVTFPGGLNPGDCACYRLIITSADGSLRSECEGRYCLPRSVVGGVCTDPGQPLVVLTNLEPTTVSFNLRGTGSSATMLDNARYVVLSPEGLAVGGSPLPPIVVPPAGGGTVPVEAHYAFPEYDPGRKYNLVLEADSDGDGQYEPLGQAELLNVLPSGSSEPTLEIRRIPGGPIIIVWPNPCATIEWNGNPANPAGWQAMPGVTSPLELDPATLTDQQFFRLRE